VKLGLFDVNVDFTTEADGRLTPNINISRNSKQNIIAMALLKYWRWVAEGKKPYAGGQVYYNTYHDYIEFQPETGTYKYRIQVYDSPEYDE
jgi:hypothetical protein